MLTWTDPVVCDGADTGPQGPLLASPHRSPGKRGVAVPSASLGSPPPSFLVYQAQGVSAVGQTQVCAPAFAAKAAGKASPGPGFHSGKQLSLSLKLTWWGVSQIVPGDSGVAWPLKITNLHYPPPHTHPNSRLPLCCSPSPPSHHSPHLITDLSEIVEMILVQVLREVNCY